MRDIWVDSLSQSLEKALDLLADAVRDSPENLWESPMWRVAEPGSEHQFLAFDWRPITDPVERETLARRWAERFSTPWSVAWHALETLDYDLSGEFEPWMPPPPFKGHPHWRDLPSLPAAWSRPEIQGYIDYCRGRVRDTLLELDHQKATRLLPQAHRYNGQPHASILMGMIGHTTEHAAQIRQFITSAGEAAVG